MTTTIPEQELDIEFILWEAEDPFDRPCEKPGGCPNVAVYRVFWGPDTSAPPANQDNCCNSSQICLRCFDRVTQTDGLIACARCEAQTGDYFFKRVKRSEPIRG